MNKLSALKKHVVRHKTAYAVTATATLCLALNRWALADHNAFLEEKGLLEEFYQAAE